MKIAKAIAGLLSVCISLSACSIEKTAESAMDETSSDNYFAKNNIVLSKPDVPKINFEKDFCAQVDNNFIDTASEDYLNFAFVDDNNNCYVQLHNNLYGYNSGGELIGKYDIHFGCYKINNTLYTWRQDSADIPDLFSIYAINLKDGVKRKVYYNTSRPILCHDKLYFESDFKYNDQDYIEESTPYYLANGSLKPQKDVNSNADQICYERSNLTAAGDYLYTWHKEGNYISQCNIYTNETKNIQAPFRSDYDGKLYGVRHFNFTDSNFFYIEDKNTIMRTDLDFGNLTEIKLNLDLDLNLSNFMINICRNRIFVVIDYFYADIFIVEIDKNGNILNTFKEP